MKRLTALLGSLGAAVVLLAGAACGTPGAVAPPRLLEHTCGTVARPPVAAPASKCTAPRGSSRITSGYRWYTAVASDVTEPSERPKIGSKLDGDWWDPNDQAEVG